MSKDRLNVVIPMAGLGSRFGYRFKPFLEFNGSTFIEAAVRPFRKIADRIETLTFITLQEFESQHSVSRFLRETFPDLPVRTICLPNQTEGPAETIQSGLRLAPVHGPTIICDCDHELDITPQLAVIDEVPTAACVIPVWSITRDETASWSVARTQPDGSVTTIEEKAWPEGDGDAYGVIGCYFFRNIEDVLGTIEQSQCRALSHAIQLMISSGDVVRMARIDYAHFFGDPQRLRTASIQSRANDGDFPLTDSHKSNSRPSARN